MSSSISDLHLLVSNADSSTSNSISQPNTLYLSVTVKKTLDAAIKLKESTNETDYVNSVIVLRDLCDKDDALLCMEDYRPHRYVIEYLPKYRSNLAVEKEAVNFIFRLCKRSQKLRENIQNDSDFITYLTKMCEAAIHENAEYNEVLDSCLSLLALVLLQSQHSAIVAESKTFMSYLCEGILSDNIPLIVNSAKILSTFHPKDYHLLDFVVDRAGEFARMIDTYMTSQTVMVNLCSFLDFIIANSDRAISALVQHSLPALLIRAVVSNSLSHSPAHFASLVSLLTSVVPHYQPDSTVDCVAFQEYLHDNMMKYADDLTVQTFGIKVFYYSLGYLSQLKVLRHLDEGWLRVIYRAMTIYRDKTLYSEWACKTVVLYFLLRPDLLRFVGDEVAEKQDNLHTCIFGMFLFKPVNMSTAVICSASDALFVLVSQSSRLQNLLMLKNVHLSILSSINNHCNSVFVLIRACRALRGLALFNPANQNVMFRDGVLERISDLFRRFYSNVDVLTESVITLTTLSEQEAIRHQIVLGIFKTCNFDLEHFLQKFLLNRKFQEACLELLCVLSAADGAIQFFAKGGYLELSLRVAMTHPDSYHIQKHVLIFIQLLAQEIDASDLMTISAITDCIMTAMKTFPDYLGIQTEGCIAGQILAERHIQCGPIFLEKRFYECAFDILEKFPHHSDLFNVAAEFIYIIVCERQLKSTIMIEAIAQGHVKVVHCLLELGASPNSVNGGDSPLSVAVRFNDEHCALQIVRSLLDKGATESLTALELCIEKNYFCVAGMLLKEIGFDKLNETLSWCNLNLTEFRQEWLQELICHKNSDEDVFRIQMRKLARKIKNCQEIRVDRRLAYDYVSSQKLPFRFYLTQSDPDRSNVLSDQETSRKQLKSPNRGKISKMSSKFTFPQRNTISEERDLKYARNSGPNSMPFLAASTTETENYQENSFSQITSLTQLELPKTPSLQDSNVEPRFENKPHFNSENPENSQSGSESSFKISRTNFSLPFHDKSRRSTEFPKSLDYATKRCKGNSKQAIERLRARRITLNQVMYDKHKYLSDGELVADNSSLQKEETRVVFLNINGEFEDFLGTTLSGASLPFSLKDPRRGGNRPLSEIEYRTADLDPANTLVRRSFDDYLRPAGIVVESRPTIMTPVSSASSHEHSCLAKSDPPEREFEEEENVSTTSEQTDSSVPELNEILLSKVADRYELSEDSPKRSNSTVSRLARKRSLVSPKLSLKVLDLSNNSMTSINALTKIRNSQQLMMTFSQLTKLNLSRNKLTSISSEIWSFMNRLVSVDLDDNKLDEFPIALLKHCPLENLDLSNNLIRDINVGEDTIDQFSSVTFSLKVFLLSNNSLSVFPTELISSLFGLEELSLKGNRLRELPEVSFMLRRLKVLNLANNYFKRVSDEFLGEFPNLQDLNLSCNELESLPSGNTVDKMTSLLTLKLANNLLSTKEPFYIPNFILRLVSLRYLDLSNNQLTGFPSPEKWSSQSLCDVILAHNQIQELVLTNAQNLWRHLERLSVSHNALKELPPEIGYLSKLSRLDISYNSQITTLPDELGKLNGQLWDMPTDGLKLNFDEALLKPPRRNLLGYLHNRLKRSVEYYGLKLMLVGYGGKGKTSLLRALMKEKTIKDAHNNVATLGINVQLWKYPCKHKGQSVDYRFSCWDFAGQEEFYSTHQCFLSKRALYLVLYDLRKGANELKCLEPWLLNIRAQAPGSPVIIVGTHVDSIPDKERNIKFLTLRQSINEMCQSGNFPKIWDFAEVDARRDNFTVEQLRVKLVEVLEEFTINGECVMGQKIPASFVRLEELIRGMASSLPTDMPILQHKQILKIVKDANLDLDETELQQAVRFLHDSGVLLHFDDPMHGLNNLYFVNPQWLCRMMAQVVTVRDVNPFIKDGMMKVENLKLLFTGKRITEGDRVFVFPTSQIVYYMRLLEKFEVALTDGEDELLIPSRLPSTVPVFKELLNKETGKSVIYRDYRMTFLPTGFWPRLIARIHALLANIYQSISTVKREYIKVSLWNRGFYVYWSPEVYFVVEGWYTNKENLRIKTARSKMGVKLLVQLIDCVDILIEEWFPGLLEVDLSGRELLERIIPCPHCQATSQTEKHFFSLSDVIVQSEMEDWIACPLYKRNHSETETISLSWIVPDVLLTDLNPEFQLDSEKLQLLQTHEYLLGQGAFGSVYRATYRDEACAVKMFANTRTDIPLYRLLRQEVEVLRKLQHPALIQLLGVDRHFIVLELAPMGSLSALLSQKRIRSRRLIHRISLQVTEGLAFLHEKSIIYRDLKPENVLVYSLNTERCLVNVKLSDYGISRLITPYGFVQEIGTPGFMAPEVIRSQQYDLSADIYSLGILFYTLVTDGRHPFEEPGFPERGNYNEAILTGRKPDAIYKQNGSTWPDLQILISQCLEKNPACRPTVQVVLNQLRSVEFIALRQRIPVTKEDNIDCMTVRINENGHIEIFTASGGDRLVQVSWNDLNTGKSRGALIKDYRVLSTLSCSQHILLGTQSGRIWVYHMPSDRCIHTIGPLGDAVLAITQYGSSGRDSLVIAGLANGEIVIFNRLEMLESPDVVPKYIPVGDSPVRCICSQDGKVFLSCGNVIHIFKKNKEQEFFTMHELCIVGSENQFNKRKLVNCIKVQNNSIFTSIWGDSKIYHYDTNGGLIGNPFDIHKMISDWFGEEISQNESRVTCILVWQNNQYLAVGTGGGYFLVIDVTDNYHVLVGRYKDAIRAIDRINFTPKNKGGSSTIDRSMRVKSSSTPVLPEDMLNFSLLDTSLTEQDNPDRLTSCLIVSGLAFHSSFDIDKTDTCAFLTIWQDDILEEHRRLQNDIEGRQNLITKF